MARLVLLAFLSLAFQAAFARTGFAELDPYYYSHSCPQALPTIRAIVEEAVARERRMGASLLRLHFHDCFVNGCDGSVLLDDTAKFAGEKNAPPNQNSLRGFEVIDAIKAAVNSVCHGNVVSCADILAVAARDSVHALGGPYYQVQLGRRDSRTASKAAATANIPSPFANFTTLLSNFRSKGLSLKDLVVLSGGHTVGLARCFTFRSRIYNETTKIHPAYAAALRQTCPVSGGNNNHAHLDGTSSQFDTNYYGRLLARQGLLHSDQELYRGFKTSRRSERLVQRYAENTDAFWRDFGVSMARMGSISPLAANHGEIRMNCRRIN